MQLNSVQAAICVAALATWVGGCRHDAATTNAGAPAPSASGSVGVTNAVPVPVDKVRAAVDPKGEAPYSGPIGSVAGTIHVVGDTPPVQSDVLAKIGDKCAAARPVYARLFREGEGRTLADVVVAVTGYKGYLPARDPVHLVHAKGCAWQSRTIAMMFGQRLDVKSDDGHPYLPELLGAGMASQMVAVPGGGAVHLYANRPGRYVLTDTLNPFMFADVLVVKYPTTAVTGLDGKYRIDGIPAGKVKVSAFLPMIMQTSEKDVTIESGETATVDLEISFDKAKYEAERPKPAPSASAARKAPTIR